MKMIRNIFTLLIVFFSMIAKADVNTDFDAANQLYAEGNYEDAIKAYETIIDNGQVAPDFYYNLGNAYYKTGNIPASILNYEKALKLQPDNEDALFNLNMANKQTIDKIDRLPEMFIGSSWRNLITSRTVSDWATYCVGLIFLALVFFIIYLLMRNVIIKKIGFYTGILFFALSMFSLLMASQHHGIIKESTEAIIFASSTGIVSEPNENSEKLFTLHEGTKVKLLETTGDWSKIKLPNGNVGWIESSKIKTI